MVFGMLGCPLGAVGARRFEGLWQPVPAYGNGLRGLDAPIEEFARIHRGLEAEGRLIGGLLGGAPRCREVRGGAAHPGVY